MQVKRTERGWGGHFICASRCRFRRNTLLECNGQSVVVSTVGNMRDPLDGSISTVGAGRYYETMAFVAHKDGAYMEADVQQQLSFDAPWSICAESVEALPEDVDNRADQMHEAVVVELTERLQAGEQMKGGE